MTDLWPDLLFAGGGLVASAVGTRVWYQRRKRTVLAIEDVRAALVEQVRREKAHHLPYRADQRELAMQQRLSRKYGELVWHESAVKQIRAALEQASK